jgi:hypothetical protein
MECQALRLFLCVRSNKKHCARVCWYCLSAYGALVFHLVTYKGALAYGRSDHIAASLIRTSDGEH